MDAITKAQHGLLKKLGRLTDSDAMLDMVSRHPILLDLEVLEDLQDTIDQAPGKDRPDILAGWERAQHITERLAADGHPFLVGAGPVEELQRRVDSGEISRDRAETLARGTDVLASIGPRYFDAMGQATALLVRQGDWRRAVAWQRLLWIAVNAWPSPHAARHRLPVGIDFVQMTARLLVDVADGRFYREALAAGSEILEEAERDEQTEIIWNVSRRLGILHLDPYTAARSSLDYQDLHTAWLRNVRDALGDEYFSIDRKELAMPEPKDALALAEKHLRRAAELSTGHDRGLNLKALAQALQWRQFVGGPPYHRDEFVQIGREALELLDPEKEPESILYVQNMLKVAGEKISAPSATLDKPVEEYLAEHGPAATLEVILHSTPLMEDGEEALELLRRTRAVFEKHGGERRRLDRWLHMAGALRRIAPEAEKTREKSLAEARTLLRDALSGRGGNQLLATALLAWAFATRNWDGEQDGLAAVEEALAIDPSFGERFDDLVPYLRMYLHSGAGKTALMTRQMMPALTHYGEVLRGAVELGLPKAAADALYWLQQAILLREPSREALEIARLAVVPSALGVAAFGDLVAGDMLRRFLQRWFVLFCTDVVSVPHALTAQQLLKGNVFGSLLADTFAAAALGDAEERADTLERIAELSGRHRDDPDTDLTPAADYLLAAFVSDVEQKTGTSNADRLANLRRAFDRRLNAAQVQLARGREQRLVDPRYLQAALDGDAVFLDYCIVPQQDALGLYITMLTREEVFIDGITMPEESSQRAILAAPGGQKMIVDWFGMIVSHLRGQLTEDPGFGELTSEADGILSATLPLLFGNLVERLRMLPASMHVLYVAPHRALHFLPFALLGGRAPLADRWTVVSVPNVRLALRGRGPARRVDRSIASIGLGFSNDTREGLYAMPGAVAEGRRVAAIFGEEAIVDAAATKANVFEAMSAARLVHISTHGAHDVGAPAFQTIYLTPDGACDGRLFAHEILALDLHHVELLTLSACETALGRIDADDNPRGLAASFFLAGVRSIVGTLWPSGVQSSELFFATMYAAIHGGTPVIDAFRIAQVETRRCFPQYRDWGAFHIMSSPTENAIAPTSDERHFLYPMRR